MSQEKIFLLGVLATVWIKLVCCCMGIILWLLSLTSQNLALHHTILQQCFLVCKENQHLLDETTKALLLHTHTNVQFSVKPLKGVDILLRQLQRYFAWVLMQQKHLAKGPSHLFRYKYGTRMPSSTKAENLHHISIHLKNMLPILVTFHILILTFQTDV